MNEQTQKEMRQKLDDFQLPPPDVSWDALERALERNSRQRRAGIWRRVGMAAAVALLLASGIWWILQKEDDNDMNRTQQARRPVSLDTRQPAFPATETDTATAEMGTEQTSSPSSIPSKEPPSDRPAPQPQFSTQTASKSNTPDNVPNKSDLKFSEPTPHIHHGNKHIATTPTSSLASVSNSADSHPDNNENLPRLAGPTRTEGLDTRTSTMVETEKDSVTTIQDPSTKILAETADNSDKTRQTQQRPDRPFSTLPHHSAGIKETAQLTTSPRLSAKAFMANSGIGSFGTSMSRTSDAQYTSPGSQSDYTSQDPFGDDQQPGDNDNPSGDNGNSTGNSSARKIKAKQTDEGRVRHHQPIRFGFSVSYRLNERWSIEGGISYTRQNTDITNGKKNSESWTHTEQQLNYIGIPLSVNYNIWQNKHFNIYASGGAMLEKMVKGEQIKKEMNYHIVRTKWTAKDIHIHSPQFSLNAAVGAAYKFNRTLSVYAEPGFSYHFNDNSAVHTLYNDNPLGFGLSFGLRVKIK